MPNARRSTAADRQPVGVAVPPKGQSIIGLDPPYGGRAGKNVRARTCADVEDRRTCRSRLRACIALRARARIEPMRLPRGCRPGLGAVRRLSVAADAFPIF